jgi:hypothetical protein
MCPAYRALRAGVTFLIGLALGWGLAHRGSPTAQASHGGVDSEDQIAVGPISIEYNSGLKIQVPHDAIYYLDYRAGRLLATLPSPTQTVGGGHWFEGFAERDLVADFKLTPGSSTPKFSMVTGTLGALNGAWAPLYVFESSTRQVAIYRLSPQRVGTLSKPQFELLEIRSFAPTPPPTAARRSG